MPCMHLVHKYSQCTYITMVYWEYSRKDHNSICASLKFGIIQKLPGQQAGKIESMQAVIKFGDSRLLKITFSWSMWRRSLISLSVLLASILLSKALPIFLMATSSRVSEFTAALKRKHLCITTHSPHSFGLTNGQRYVFHGILMGREQIQAIPQNYQSFQCK